MGLEVIKSESAASGRADGMAIDVRAQSEGDTKASDESWKPYAALLAAGAIGVGALAFFATRTPLRRELAWRLLKAAAGSPRVRSVVIAATAGLARWQLGRLFTPQADYDVEARFGDIEVRRYPMTVVAEVNVVAPTSGAAQNQGFERLASYIFGENRPLRPEGDDDTMGERIPMTAPVLTQRNGRSWLVGVTMPAGYTLENLPVPKERGIHLRAIPPHRVAALRYSGTFGADKTSAMVARLIEQIHEYGLDGKGEPIFAGYDRPTTLPVLRRNEAWIELGRGSERHVAST